MKITPFPVEFPHKGEFYVWDSRWNKVGYSDTPQYPGSQPIRYPVDATLLEIQLGGRLL